MSDEGKNPAAVAMGRMKSEKKAAASRLNGQLSGKSPEKPRSQCYECGKPTLNKSPWILTWKLFSGEPPRVGYRIKTDTHAVCRPCNSTLRKFPIWKEG